VAAQDYGRMSNIKPDPRSIVMATLASAILGGVLFILLIFNWPRPVIDWMRVIVPNAVHSPPAELAAKVTAVFVVVTLFLAVGVLGTRWLLRRLKIANPVAALTVLFLSVFLVTLIAVSQKIRASGNLTAADATGLIIDETRLTAHGWETIARRSLVASLYASLIATAFWTVSSALTRRGSDL
jgi:hypothetical protein